MNLIQYLNACVDPCNAVLCSVLLGNLVLKRNKEKPSKLLLCLLLMGVVVNVAETIYFFYSAYDGETGASIVRVSNFISFASLFILVCLEESYLRERLRALGGIECHRVSIGIYLLCGTGLVLLFLNEFFGVNNAPDDQKLLTVAEHNWANMVIWGSSLILMLIQVILNHGVFHRREYKAFFNLSVFPLVILIIQCLAPDLSLYGIAFSVPVLIISFSYLREVAATTMVGENLKLTNENIFFVYQELDKFMKFFDMEKRNRFKARMTIEEVLLRLQDRYGEEEDFDIYAFVSFGRPQIRIEKEGDLFNPLNKGDGDVYMENWSGGMMVSLGLSPVFSYAGGRNILKMQLERQQMNPSLMMIITLMIGVIAGVMAINTLSVTDQSFLSKDILYPVYEMMSNLLYCVTGPILFIMVVAVMLDSAGISEQGGSSTSLVSRYFIIGCVVGIVTLLVSPVFVGLEFKEVTLGRSEIKTLLSGILSVVPRDVFTPFVEANTPQLILMTIVLGLAIVTLGARTRALNIWLKQANLVCVQLARWIGMIIPYFAIFMALWIILNGMQITLVALIPLILGSVAITIICMAGYMGVVCLKEHVRPSIILQKCMPSFMNSLISGSLDTSYGLSERCCTRGLGVERHFVSVSLPLGLVMFMPANVVGTMLFTLYAMKVSSVTVSPLWMLLSVILAVILFVATPPIPGANFLAYIVMISVLGIDERVLGLALIFEVIFGSFAAPANQFFVQLEMVMQAKRMGILDEDLLRKEDGSRKRKSGNKKKSH